MEVNEEFGLVGKIEGIELDADHAMDSLAYSTFLLSSFFYYESTIGNFNRIQIDSARGLT